MPDPIAINVCGLQPPEPLERVLDALDQLEPDQELVVTIDREPHPLFRILKQNNYAYTSQLTPDYLYEIHIRQSD